MSSILEALKKLEKEKIHRDEISTAIASDILRSGKKSSIPQWRIPLALFLLVIFASGLTLYFSRSTVSAPIVQAATPPVVKVEPIIVSKAVEALSAVSPAQSLSSELPLLSGIVFQKQASARMAILNDLPVMEGTIVAGYTLQEIFADHVLLTRQGQSFSLFMLP